MDGIARVYFRMKWGGLIIPCWVHSIGFVAFLAWILYSSITPHCTILGFRSGDVTESKVIHVVIALGRSWYGLGKEKKRAWWICQSSMTSMLSTKDACINFSHLYNLTDRTSPHETISKHAIVQKHFSKQLSLLPEVTDFRSKPFCCSLCLHKYCTRQRAVGAD